MASNTPKSLRNSIVYEVFVRNHGKNGTFADVINDLDRIRELGTDILWLMPIHPIGMLNKKGSLGCPYSIRDYRKINSEYGTEEDFQRLIDGTHEKGMKLMIDVVYNHTSHDAVYTRTHPEYYYRKPNGDFGNRIADWGDIIDLDYGSRELWDEQINALKKWAKMGVDGFRCDVAPFIPIPFWSRARNEIAKINSDFVWLAETVHPHFLEEARAMGLYCASDSQTFDAFDITYDYDTHLSFLTYLAGGITLEELLEKKRAQEYIYPENYVKLRFLENHDNPRAKSILPDENQLRMWTAFMFFEKGTALLYAGQEALNSHRPDLFDTDKIDWNGLDDSFTAFLKALAEIKKRQIPAEGVYKIHKTAQKGVIYASYSTKGCHLIGIFNVENKIGELDLTVKNQWGGIILTVPDGTYTNLIDGTPLKVKGGKAGLTDKAVVFAAEC